MKINLILDLDDTLINTLQFNFSNHQTTELDFINKSTIGIINLPNYLTLVFLRPCLKNFLDFCFTHFNVGFWTAGSSLYCREVLKLLLTDDQYNKTSIILAKENACYINLKNNKIFYCEMGMKVNKKLDILWNDVILGEIFKLENTLIVDDNPNILTNNPLNSINISPYSRKDLDDKVLCQLSNWLYVCKDFEDVRKLNKELSVIPKNCYILESLS